VNLGTSPAVALSFLLLASSAVLSCSGCDDPAPEVARTERGPAPDPAPPEPEPALYLNAALRCGECHAAVYDEWRASAHAESRRSPAFVAMRASAGAGGSAGSGSDDEAGACARCHAPLELHAPGRPELAAEGVTCDTCHTVSEVEVGAHHARFELVLTDNVKYGPLCDAREHYFHRMGCSPLHSEARVCAGCHLYERRLESGVVIPVYTEYREWAEGPYASERVACQHCHMPDVPGEVATGSAPRDDLSHHGFLGRRRNLRRRALEMRVAVEPGTPLDVAVTLENRGAGHRVPTGFPGRQLVVRVVARGRAGDALATAEHVYERRLVDERGAVAPHPLATEVRSDNRIGPRESVTDHLALDAPAARSVTVELVWRAMSPALRARIGTPDTAEETLLAAEVRLGSGRRRARGTPVGDETGSEPDGIDPDVLGDRNDVE